MSAPKFKIAQQVIVDGATDLKPVVIAVLTENFSPPRYEISWFANGAHHSLWVHEWRLQDDTRRRA